MKELRGWMAVDRISPIGFERIDWVIAKLTQYMLGMVGDKSPLGDLVMQFDPESVPKREPVSPKSIEAMLRMHAGLSGSKIIDKRGKS